MISLHQVSKSLGGVQILKNLSFTVENKQIVCILGPSGCGKTTTLRLLSGLEQPDSGKVTGLNNIQVSYAFQEPRLLPWKTVEDNLHFVLKSKIPLPERQHTVDHYLKLTSLINYRDYYPQALSGGMKQRLSLCRAFAFPHRLLLMDEPFRSLDAPLRMALVNETVKLWQLTQNSIVFVTHDIAVALLLGNKILLYSTKPTSVRAEYILNTPHSERNLSDQRLAKLYNEFLKILSAEYC